MKKDLMSWFKGYLALAIVIAIILLETIVMTVHNQWPLWTGERIVLATRPIDPFGPIRGQYIDITYEITNLNNTLGFKMSDPVYVLLKQDDKDVWRFNGISKDIPSEGDFIKGYAEMADNYNLFVRYGIEQYFFERDAEIDTRNMTVELKVSASGRPKIIQLLKDGKPIEIKYADFSVKS
jgi:uncharacterized membrane-anchored protein